MDLTDIKSAPRFDMTPEERDYFLQLALDIVAHGGFGARDPLEVIQEAHGRRQAFMREVLDGKTTRAKEAVSALRSTVFLQLQRDPSEERHVAERRTADDNR